MARRDVLQAMLTDSSRTKAERRDAAAKLEATKHQLATAVTMAGLVGGADITSEEMAECDHQAFRLVARENAAPDSCQGVRTTATVYGADKTFQKQ